MKIKQIFILVALMMALLLPCSLSAQWGKSDNFFNDFDNSPYGNRDGGSYIITFGGSGGVGGTVITNQTFDQELPIGSGLLVMTMAGAGYVLIKKRRKNNAKTE